MKVYVLGLRFLRRVSCPFGRNGMQHSFDYSLTSFVACNHYQSAIKLIRATSTFCFSAADDLADKILNQRKIMKLLENSFSGLAFEYTHCHQP